MASDSRALSRASRMPASGLAGSTLICFDGSESGRPAGSDQKAPWLGWGFETGEGWLGGLVHNQENVKKNLGVQFKLNDVFFARYEGQFEELKQEITFSSAFFTVVDPHPCHDVLVVPSLMILGFVDCESSLPLHWRPITELVESTAVCL